jgi:hypothetical protein
LTLNADGPENGLIMIEHAIYVPIIAYLESDRVEAFGKIVI